MHRRKRLRWLIALAIVVLAGACCAFFSTAIVTMEAPSNEQDPPPPGTQAASREIPRHVPRDEVDPAPVPPPAIELDRRRETP